MSLISELYWREPLWVLLALLPLIFAVLKYKALNTRRQRLVDADLMPWVQSKRGAEASLGAQLISFTAWLLIVIAICGPRTPVYIPPELEPPAAEVILISDLSGSMEATEVLLDDGSALRRRDAVTRVMQHWNEQVPENINMGLMVFAAHPHWLLKPSSDPLLREHILNQLEAVQAPTLGNDLAAALEATAQPRVSADTPRRIILFTDGDIEIEQRQRTASRLEQLLTEFASLRVTVVGIGANEMSRLVDGNTTRLESKWLKQLAENNRVDYLTLQQASAGELSSILQLPRPRIDASVQDQVLWHEWFALPLIAALLLLVVLFQRTARLRRRHA